MAVAIKVDLEDRELRRLISRLSRSGLKPALESIGETGVSLAQAGFSASQDPYGRPWRPIKPYLRRLPGGRTRYRGPDVGSKPLLDTGLTRGSFFWRLAGAGEVLIGSPMQHLVYHQGGDETVMPGSLGNKGLPQRRVLPAEEQGFPRSWQAEFLEAVQAHIRQGIR